METRVSLKYFVDGCSNPVTLSKWFKDKYNNVTFNRAYGSK